MIELGILGILTVLWLGFEVYPYARNIFSQKEEACDEWQ